jgi:hypothetical protein
MSSLSSRAAGQNTTSSSVATHTTRPRSNTRTISHPPRLDLQSPPSQPIRSGSTTHETRNRSKPTVVDSTISPYGPSYPSSKTSPLYGPQITLSPLTISPDTLTSFMSDTSHSLPTLSALASEPQFDPVSIVNVKSPHRPPSPHKLSPSVNSPSSSHSLVSHLSHMNLRLHTARTTRSAPISRKPSAGSLDRDASLHFDMKRLLSKPAPASHSGSSIVSITSDPEFSSPTHSSHQPQQRSFSHQAQSSRRLPENIPVRRVTDSITPKSTHVSSTQTQKSASKGFPTVPTSREVSTNPPQRNVLRRKSSARSNPSTPTATTFKNVHNETASRSGSSSNRRSASGNPQRALSATATATPVSLDSFRRTRQLPADLTPAGAVAHAYKQQEQRREELADISGSNDQLQQRKDRPPSSSETAEEEGGIYYTVFGSAAGQVVAMGSVADSSWDAPYDLRRTEDVRAKRVAKDGGSSSSSIPSRLGRKLSGRFRKASNGAVKHGRDQSPHDGFGRVFRQPDEPYDGRPSLSEKKAATAPVTQTTFGRGTSTSVDGFVDVKGLALPSVKNGSPEKVEAERRHKEGKVLRSVKSVIGKDKENEKEPSTAGKFQKLMKRFSSAGGLRDRYAREATPPVPALPKDFQQPASSRTTFDNGKSSGSMSLSDSTTSPCIRSRVSLTGVRPSTAPYQEVSRKEASGLRSSTGPRPSTATGSSSPMSSDIASTRFFPKAPHSTRSSVSSYGVELPPLPSAIAQYILSPSELSRLNKENEDDVSKRKSLRARTRSSGPGDSPTSLPPPRRQDSHHHAPSPASSFPPSPTIPSFSVDDPVNNFLPSSVSRLSLPTSEFGVMDDITSAPPRPRRSSRRKPPPPDLVPSSSTSAPTSPPEPITPRTPRSPNIPKLNVNITRASIGTVSSPRSASQEGSHSSPASSTTRSPMRFRVMESPRTQLSEAEKKARWDDLMLRSEQAGGTLHIADPGLMSDNIRFSNYSGL